MALGEIRCEEASNFWSLSGNLWNLKKKRRWHKIRLLNQVNIIFNECWEENIWMDVCIHVCT